MKNLNKVAIAVAIASVLGQANATISTLDGGGMHSLYIDNNKEVIVTGGAKYFKESGLYAKELQLTPVVYGVGNAISVVGTGFRTVVLKSDNTVWISGREQGQEPIQLDYTNVSDVASTGDTILTIQGGVLYEQNLSDSSEPYIVDGLPSNIVEVSAAFYHCLVLTADGQVYTWGHNTQGQLADGSTIDDMTPKLIEGVPEITQISTSEGNNVLTDINGDVWITGEGRSGMAGNGTDEDELAPYKLPIPNTGNVLKGYAGRTMTVVHYNDGTVSMVGWHNYIGTDVDNYSRYNRDYEFITIPQLTDVVDVSISGTARLFRLGNGDIVGWAGNGYGQLGNGEQIETHTPGIMDTPIYPDGYVVEYEQPVIEVEVLEPIQCVTSEPIIVEKIVYEDKIVEVEVETTVYVDKIVEVEVVVEVEVEVETIVYVDKIVEVETIVYVDKIVEVETIVYVDKIVEVEVEVETIVYVDKIVEVDHDNGHGNDEDGYDESNPSNKNHNKNNRK